MYQENYKPFPGCWNDELQARQARLDLEESIKKAMNSDEGGICQTRGYWAKDKDGTWVDHQKPAPPMHPKNFIFQRMAIASPDRKCTVYSGRFYSLDH